MKKNPYEVGYEAGCLYAEKNDIESWNQYVENSDPEFSRGFADGMANFFSEIPFLKKYMKLNFS